MPKVKSATMVCLNRRFLREDQANISAIEPGVLSGFGLFETMRLYHGKIVYFKTHFERLRRSCVILNIKFSCSLADLQADIRRLARLNHLDDSNVRLTVWKKCSGSDRLIIARKYTPPAAQVYLRGFSVCVGELKKEGALSQLKTTNRMVHELNFQQALKKDFDEAVMLDSRGYISECTRSNIFFVKNNELFTPSLDCGCLEGVTRRIVFDLARSSKINLYEGRFTLADLRNADEAFLTNSLMGIMPLGSLGKLTIGVNKCRARTELLIKKYRCLLG